MAEQQPRPTTDDAWRAYWQARDQPWRTQPEIAPNRQTYLAERRAIPPDFIAGVYAFGAVALTRADVEWLLATHDSGLGFIGPIPWDLPTTWEGRHGLDLRGALLDDVDLSGLPLTDLIAMLLQAEKSAIVAAIPDHDQSQAMMKRAQTHFERASFRGAHLEGAFLVECFMNDADFTGAYMNRVGMYGAEVERAKFVGAQMQGSTLSLLTGNDADFQAARLDGVTFWGSQLRRATFDDATLVPLDPFPESRRSRGLTPEAAFDGCTLEGASFKHARMTGVNLSAADLTGANLAGAHLEGANLERARLDGANLVGAHLDNVNLKNANVTAQALEQAINAPPLGDPIQLAWAAKGQPWRTQPEIDAARQEQLAARRTAPGDAAPRRYPFAGAALTRADIEWLLATHDGGRGPVDWDDPTQRERVGLDLRGADLHQVDLTGLPLARLRAGGRRPLGYDRPPNASPDAADIINLSFANLAYAHLEGADLAEANLNGATLEWARLDEARLANTQLPSVKASWAHFERATLTNATLISAKLNEASLEGVQAHEAVFQGATLRDARCSGADLNGADFSGADLSGARLDGANCRRVGFVNTQFESLSPFRKPAILQGASLVGVNLTEARLDDVTLAGATLHGSSLINTHLENADLTNADLAGADLRRAIFTAQTRLDGARFVDGAHGPARLAGLVWGNVDLAGVDWQPLQTLGDEHAMRRRDRAGQRRTREDRLIATEEAVRANAQLATALTQNGLNEEAARYAYRSQVLQRTLLWRQMLWRGEVWRLGAYMGAALLESLTGYGYRVGRIVVAYLLIVLACAALLFALGLHTGHTLAPQDAFLISLTAFHGRVFSGQFAPDSPQSWITAIEAIVGLIIESVFIAMLTQRFFGR
ncbi:MAG TPA: pentapeptide repeat-containing protein [Ktedonobacterales bacterium]|nr:pentapeptide repeat-containing protein [Ktedonobacterales bacterium]